MFEIEDGIKIPFENETKKCSMCNKIKNIDEFNIKISENRYYSCCRKCDNIRKQEYYKNNKEKVNAKHKEYRQTEEGKEAGIRGSKKHKELNPDYMKNYQKKYRIDNIEKYRERHKMYEMERRVTPKGKINNSISTGIYYSLINGKNGRHWEDLVGYTLKELMNNLESKFINDMSWDNYGRKKGGWSIDHIIPISSFNFESYNDDEFKKCWALENLRPLDHIENIRKSNKVA